MASGSPVSLGICREPAFLHSFLLLKEFMNGPEAAETCHSEHCGNSQVGHQKRPCTEGKTHQGECPPAVLSKMIFRLDHDRVKHAYQQKCRRSENNSVPIHKNAKIGIFFVKFAYFCGMAEKSRVFQRYQWLISLIQRSGGISFASIQKAWEDSPINANGSELNLRTFHRHRNEIEEIFGLEIVCDKGTNLYYIGDESQMGEDGVQDWMLSTIAVDSMLNESRDLRDRIQFEHIPSGREHLGTIIDAMRAGKVLNMTYHNFTRGTDSFIPLEPYFIKVFEQRWYVIGCSQNHPENKTPRVYALDRITDLEISGVTFDYPSDFDPKGFFTYSYGVFHMDEKPQLVKLKVTPRQALFMDSLPIHASQEKVEQTEQYTIYTLYLTPALDFVQYILSQGSSIEVLEPESLREAIATQVEQLSSIYTKIQ